MAVVLDTNVVLQARAAGHPFHVIVESLLAGRFILAVSAAILRFEVFTIGFFLADYRRRFVGLD
jgi:hypothetical protein